MNYVFHTEDKEAAYLFNQAHDRVTEVQSRLAFLLDSAPLSSTACSFSEEGIRGMGWVVGDMVDTLEEAKRLLEMLTQLAQKLDSPKEDQHGPTSFSFGE